MIPIDFVTRNWGFLPDREWHVARAVAGFCDNDSYDTIAGLPKIAAIARYNRRRVQTALSNLVEAGLLEKRNRGPGTRRYTILEDADLRYAKIVIDDLVEGEKIADKMRKEDRMRAEKDEEVTVSDTSKNCLEESVTDTSDSKEIPSGDGDRHKEVTVTDTLEESVTGGRGDGDRHRVSLSDLSKDISLSNSLSLTPPAPKIGGAHKAEALVLTEEELYLNGLQADLTRIRAICREMGLQTRQATPKLNRALINELQSRIDEGQKMAEQDMHEFISDHLGLVKTGTAE